jgi:ribose transport system substrate-binding protein
MKLTNGGLWRVAVAVLVLVLALAGCGSDDEGASNGASGSGASADAGGGNDSPNAKKIGISFPNAKIEASVQYSLKVAEKTAEELGYEIVIDDPGTDLNRQLNAINTWVQQKYGAVIVVTLNPDAFGNVVERATSSGVKWFTYGSTLPGETGKIDLNQIKGGQTIGRLAGEWITKELGGDAKVALLSYEADWAREREKGIREGLKETAPNAKVVAEQAAVSESQGLSATTNLLSAHPDLNAVLGVLETGTEGAYQAFLNKGFDKNDPKVFIGGIDGTERALKLLKEGGTMYRGSAGLDLTAVGEEMIKVAANAIEGKEPTSWLADYTPLTQGSSEIDRFLTAWE